MSGGRGSFDRSPFSEAGRSISSVMPSVGGRAAISSPLSGAEAGSEAEEAVGDGSGSEPGVEAAVPLVGTPSGAEEEADAGGARCACTCGSEGCG